MGSAYTPGLTVSSDITIRRTRRLPIKGEVLVKEGDQVEYDTVVARAILQGNLQTIKLSEKLGVEPKDAKALFRLNDGDRVEAGQVVAETKGLFGKLFKTEVKSDFTGIVESFSDVTGSAYVREPGIPVDVEAYIKGHVASVIPDEGAIVETRCAMVQGIFGVGGERQGEIRCAVSNIEETIDGKHISAADKGKILIGGSGVTLEAIEKAVEFGVTGLVAGGVRDSDLTKFLGYDIGVAITGQENITLTLLVTEGFGHLQMAQRTFDLLKSLEGQSASINGATQIRAGVIRPEIIVPIASGAAVGAPDKQLSELKEGTPIRVIREPYFGMLGKVTALPAQLVVVDSGTEVRVLRAKLDKTGEEVTVPRANVEIIAG